MSNIQQVPYWRLSSFYFFYFAALGALLPYWSLYLQSIEFDATTIGQLTAILVATKIIAPNILGWVADHYGKRMRIIQVSCFIAAVSFAGAFFTTSFTGLAMVMVLFGFFWNPTLSQFEVITLNHLGDSPHAYSRIRVWGSVGFIITVWLLGLLFEHYPINLLLICMLVLMSLIYLSSLMVKDHNHEYHRNNQQSVFTVLKKPEVIALIAVCFLMQVSHAPYYTFYSIYLEEHNYSRGFIGQMWALGVIAEVFVFFYMQHLSYRFSIRLLLIVSLLLASFRWCLIAVGIEQVEVLIFAQLLHAASFGLYHACAIQLFHKMFTGSIQGRGQAIYSSMSFGAGLSLGSLISGYSWQVLGSATTFFAAAVVSLVAVLISWVWIR